MKIQSPEPRGIDFLIQEFQNYLYPKLLVAWGLNDSDVDGWACYDRVYQNQTKDGIIPEVYTNNGNYKEVLLDDKLKAISFFGIGNQIQVDSEENQNEIDVHLVFFVNLNKLKSSDLRMDEKTRLDVQRLSMNSLYGMNLISIQIGVDSVLNEYSGFRKSTGMKYRDMQPFHCFRLNYRLRYDYDKHEC